MPVSTHNVYICDTRMEFFQLGNIKYLLMNQFKITSTTSCYLIDLLLFEFDLLLFKFDLLLFKFK
jgi:hypothetical protein